MGTIHDQTAVCFHAFVTLISFLNDNSRSGFAARMPPRSVEEEFGRFKIWNGNLGALQSGHTSLDYRIRESDVMRANVLKLLEQLLSGLEQSIEVISEQRPPFELLGSDSSSDEESESSHDGSVHDGSEAPKSELRQRLLSIQSIISELYKLSFKIRSSTSRSHHVKAATYKEVDAATGVDLFIEFEKLDRLHVAECIKQMRQSTSVELSQSDYLLDRLSDAITMRRRRFRYWRRHGDKLSRGNFDNHQLSLDIQKRRANKEVSENPEQALNEAHRKHMGLGSHMSDFARTIVSGTEATTYDKKLDDMLESQSVVSYATTTYDAEGNSVRLPLPPVDATKGNGFACPYCLILCPSKHGSGRAWRTHLLHDLQPYVCTYPRCTSQTFSSRRQWLDHEGSAHRKVWQCFEHSSAVFRSKDGYLEHLFKTHLMEPEGTADMVDVAETYLLDDRNICPLCLALVDAGKDFHNHIAYHLESIACFAFPRDIQDPREESQLGSNAPQGWSEESRASLGTGTVSFLSTPQSATIESVENSSVGSLTSMALEHRRLFNEGYDFGVYSEILNEDQRSVSDSDDNLFAIRPLRTPNKTTGEATSQGQINDIVEDTSPDKESYVCPMDDCGATFDEEETFDLHMKEHGSVGFACKHRDCGKKFFRFDDFRAHLEAEHGKDANSLDSPASGDGKADVDLLPGVLGSSSTFKWMKGALIGKGTWSKCYLALNATSGELIVVKEISYSKKGGEDLDRDGGKGMREDTITHFIDILSNIKHDNVVRYLGHEHSIRVDTDSQYSIFMEYLSGSSLGQCLRKYGKFEPQLVASFTRQILKGLSYLHQKGILHRDIKADKVLFDLDGTCKLDLSFTTTKIEDPPSPNFGSIFWQAPEVIQNVHNYSTKADIWSLGCTVLELLSGRRPFSEEEVVGAVYKLGTLNEAPPIPKDLDKDLDVFDLNFLFDCFTIDPERRPSAELLLASPFCLVEDEHTFANSELHRKILSATNVSSPLAGDNPPGAILQKSPETTNTQSLGHAAESGEIDQNQPIFSEGQAVKMPADNPDNSQIYHIVERRYDETKRIWQYQVLDEHVRIMQDYRWFDEDELLAADL